MTHTMAGVSNRPFTVTLAVANSSSAQVGKCAMTVTLSYPTAVTMSSFSAWFLAADAALPVVALGGVGALALGAMLLGRFRQH